MNRRMGVMVTLGFSSGLPLALTGTTLQAWLATSKVNIETIALFSLVGLPYTLKFLWAPVMDRYIPPMLGRRRGWMLLTQCLLVVLILWVANIRPGNSTLMLACLALAVAFFSASQDISIDAYRSPKIECIVVQHRCSLQVTGSPCWCPVGWPSSSPSTPAGG